MKHLIMIGFLFINLNLLGQISHSDSLRKNKYNDAWWARTHGDFAKAENILDSLINIEPTNPKNFFEKANIYYIKKNIDSMSIYFNKALDLGMDSMLILEEYYSYFTFQEKNNEKRIENINKMLNLQPKNSELYLKRRSVWQDLHDYDNSWEDLKKAASLGNEEAKKSMEYILETRKKIKEKGLIKQ